MNDGKHLESLVAFVEGRMLPKGFDVQTNQRVYNDDGVQIAEFDVEIRGRLGTTDIVWLIECRDRPGSGPAPGSWIEQLVGRRSRFRFNRVTAVSTTGFAEGAQAFAKQQGIELRAVEALTPDEFTWLQLEHMRFLERRANLQSATILVNESISDDRHAVLRKVVASADGSAKILRAISSGDYHTVGGVFLYAVEQQHLFDGLEPSGPGKKVTLHAHYPSDHDHFVIDTEFGEVRVEVIIFHGELTTIETLVPVNVTSRYRNLETGATISQVAAFSPQEIAGKRVALELHRMGEDGETHVILRRIDGDA
jgi:hypothetical protein